MTTLAAVLELFRRVGRCYVATSDTAGWPHLATASSLRPLAGRQDGLEVRYWFCPRTVDNLQHNPRLSVTVWDPEGDEGYQLVGKVERVEATAWLDGFDPRTEESVSYPSVERVLVVEVEQILAFRHAPHPDRVLEGKPESPVLDSWNSR